MIPGPLSCQETFRRINDYVDRELAPEEQSLVEDHLRECANCAARFDFESRLLDDLRAKLNRIKVPPTLRDRVAQALDRGYREADD